MPAGMLICPNKGCQQIFKVRSDLIRHFKNNHAEGSIACNLCQKPIKVAQFDQFVVHYQRVHPFMKIPYTGGDEKDAAEVQKVQIRMLTLLISLVFIKKTNNFI